MNENKSEVIDPTTVQTFEFLVDDGLPKIYANLYKSNEKKSLIISLSPTPNKKWRTLAPDATQVVNEIKMDPLTWKRWYKRWYLKIYYYFKFN